MNKTIQIPVENFTLENSNNDDFAKVKIMCVKEGLNLNDSNFLLEGMQKSKDSFAQKPLMCAFPKNFLSDDHKLGDGHNSELKIDEDNDTYYYSYLDSDSERCIGFIPESSNISIENIDGANWITLEGLIFKKYNYELMKGLLSKGNMPSKVSVEIEVVSSYEKDDIEYITEFIGDGITLLAIDGSVAEGIQGANLKLYGANLKTYSESPKFTRFKQALSFAYKNNQKDVDTKENAVLANDIKDIKAIKKSKIEIFNETIAIVETEKNLNKSDVLAKNKDLNYDNKKEDTMKKYIEAAKKNGFAFLGVNGGNVLFAKEATCEGEEDFKETENMSLYEISFEDANKDDKEFASADLKEKTLKMKEDKVEDPKKEDPKDVKDEKPVDNKKEKQSAPCGAGDEDGEYAKKNKELEESYVKVQAEKDELAKKNVELAKECDDAKETCAKEKADKEELAKKVAETEKEFNDMKSTKFTAEYSALLKSEDLGLDEASVTEVSKMAKEGKFNFSLEEVKREVAYRQFVKKEETINKSNKLSYGLDLKDKKEKVENKVNISDDLDKLIVAIK
jgi:hypothetical protein